MSDKSLARLLSLLAAVAGMLCVISVVLFVLEGHWAGVVTYALLTVVWLIIAALWDLTARRLRNEEKIKAHLRRLSEGYVVRRKPESWQLNLLDEMIRQADWYRDVHEANKEAGDE